MKENQTYFETIRCEDYEVFNLEYHKQRIANTVAMNFNLQEYIYPPSSDLIKCKVLYNQEGILDISYTPYQKKEIKKFKIVYDDMIEYKYKASDRKNIENLYLQKETCDDIIIIKNNYITDTSIANIAIEIDEKWMTPKIPLLFGTTRARLLQTEQIIASHITIEDLKRAKRFALMNAMIDFDIINDFKIE